MAEITTTFVGLPRDCFRILHVSTGNVCRSPITERLTRAMGTESTFTSAVDQSARQAYEERVRTN